MILRMPGRSFKGALPPLTDAQKTLAADLRRLVSTLAVDIGERNVLFKLPALEMARDFVREELAAAGYDAALQTYDLGRVSVANVEAERAGKRPDGGIVVVGAHYDSVPGSPGANDNGTGTAGMLALARHFAGRQTDRTVRFVAFVNEEPPYFQTTDMGADRYARRCRERGENVVAMISLESLGYYDDGAKSQRYPFPLDLVYPSTGNFISFVGDLSSGGLVRQAIGAFRKHARFPSEGIAAPPLVSEAGWSDHWAFWQQGFKAIMVTDTAVLRDPYYHDENDLPAHVDFERMARVVEGLAHVVDDLANRL